MNTLNYFKSLDAWSAEEGGVGWEWGGGLFRSLFLCLVLEILVTFSTVGLFSGVVAIEPQWLPLLAPHHCTFSKPLQDPPPSWGEEAGKAMCYMKCTFGESTVSLLWSLALC